jgi:RecA-family ATPase
MVYADTGVGKSMFALSAALAVAGGGEFLGWKPEEKPDGSGWRVLYVDGEMHVTDIQERAQKSRATVKVIGGPVNTLHEIDRLHYRPPKPA